MDLETFGTLATLGSARVAYTRKQAHHVAAEGRPVFDADGKPYIEVTTRVPVDHMPGVEIVRMFDIGATLPDVVRTFVHYRPPHERWYPDYCDFWHEVPHGTQKETYDEGKVTCPWCLRQIRLEADSKVTAHCAEVIDFGGYDATKDPRNTSYIHPNNSESKGQDNDN